jgi:thiamine biosynthesis lipoprotein
MRSSPPADLVARARPLLGTLVEVALPRATAAPALFDAAFDAIAHVHRCMSAHDAESDLGRIARRAHREAVVVDPDTHAVLQLALAIGAASGGAFDITVAPALVRARRLPSHARGGAAAAAAMDAIVLEPDCRVRATRPVALDLGGIAKGHALDRAIDVLRARGVASAVVNAGGDLRVFGDARWHPVHLRHPDRPSIALPLCELRDHAIATTAGYFGDGVIAPQTQRLLRMRDSVSVIAPRCAVADALTKAVAIDPHGAPALLARYDAQAFVIANDRGRLTAQVAGAVPASHLQSLLLAAA